MTRRVVIGGLFHETNTFVEQPTRLDDFQILRGNEFYGCAGDSSPLGGVLDAATQLGWNILPAVDFRASPGGIVDDDVVEMFWDAFKDEALPQIMAGVDGIFLVLHGAMVSQSIPDVEGEILRRIRQLPNAGELPVFGVVDLHANFTEEMARYSNCLIAYRENPHTDARETAQRAAALLQRTFDTGRVPRTYRAQPPIMWPPTGTGTANDPLLSLEILAREIESRHEQIWAVNVLAGFSFADIPEAGVSFSVCTTGAETDARTELHRFCQLAEASREQGNVVEPAMETVMSWVLDSSSTGLTVLVEPADNIGAGAPGDGTGLLRAFIAANLNNAAVAINDPEAVRQLSCASIGDEVRLAIGGKGSCLDAGPLSLKVQLVSRSNGRFHLEDPRSHLASMSGSSFDMGSCAVVRSAGVLILLTTLRTPPFDLGQWRSQGVDPEKLSVIAVKAAVAHRRAYDPIAARMFWVNTPGPCCSDLQTLPYRHVRRPIYPLTGKP